MRLQRTYERRRQLEVGAEAVEQQERGTTLGTAFDGDAQRLGADFDHPDVEFSRVQFIVRHVGPIEISKGFAHQSKTYVPGAAAPAG